MSLTQRTQRAQRRWLGEIGAVLLFLGVAAVVLGIWVAVLILFGGCKTRSERRPTRPTGQTDPTGQTNKSTRSILGAYDLAQVMQMPVLTMTASTNAKPSLPKLRTVPIIFPEGTSSNLNWDVWESHDLTNWWVTERNIYPLNHCVWPTSNPTFYRIVGRLN